MKKKMLFIGSILLTSLSSSAAPLKLPDDWTQNTQPFQITENIYYVGTHGLAAYLLASGHQALLIDTGLPENTEQIEQNIKQLGFKLSDVKIMVTSHAHWDHVGALARIKQDTGAKLIAMQQDVKALEIGKPIGENTFQTIPFTPVKVDKVIHDGEVVKLGKLKLKATLTPGHTPGCTTWSTEIKSNGKNLTVVFPCSLSVAGNVLKNNHQYPNIVADYRKSFERLKNMKADIVLTSHPEVADVLGNKARKDAGQTNAFIQPEKLSSIVKDAEMAFEKSLVSSHH